MWYLVGGRSTEDRTGATPGDEPTVDKLKHNNKDRTKSQAQDTSPSNDQEQATESTEHHKEQQIHLGAAPDPDKMGERHKHDGENPRTTNPVFYGATDIRQRPKDMMLMKSKVKDKATKKSKNSGTRGNNSSPKRREGGGVPGTSQPPRPTPNGTRTTTRTDSGCGGRGQDRGQTTGQTAAHGVSTTRRGGGCTERDYSMDHNISQPWGCNKGCSRPRIAWDERGSQDRR